jgi:hypothetical protein
VPRLDQCAKGWHRHKKSYQEIAILGPGSWVYVDVPFEDRGWVVLSGVEKVEGETDMVWLLTSQGDKILYSAFAKVWSMDCCDAQFL